MYRLLGHLHATFAPDNQNVELKRTEVMEAKKKWNMDTLTDLAMTRLFQLAEYVLSVCPFVEGNPAASVAPAAPATPTKPLTPTAQMEITPSIRFSNEDRMVEGELFK